MIEVAFYIGETEVHRAKLPIVPRIHEVVSLHGLGNAITPGARKVEGVGHLIGRGADGNDLFGVIVYLSDPPAHSQS